MSIAGPAIDSQPHRLTSIMSQRCVLQMHHLALVTGLSTLFVLHSYLPLPVSLVGQTTLGEWIVQHQTVPTEDPFIALNQGVRVVDTSWLGQTLFAAAGIQFGPAGYSSLFALSVLMSGILLIRTFFLQSRSHWLSMSGFILVWALCWSHPLAAHPATLGFVCLSCLLWTVSPILCRLSEYIGPGNAAEFRLSWKTWAAVPCLFAVWGNVHASVAAGCLVLLCMMVGRLIDVGWQSRSMIAVLRDRPFRHLLILTELACAATLLNPYGIDLWLEIANVGGVSLPGLSQWRPMSADGVSVAVLLALGLSTARHSTVRFSAASVLILCVFSIGVMWRATLLTWLVPVAVVTLMPHLASVCDRVLAKIQERRSGSRKLAFLDVQSFRYTLFCGLTIWIAFAFSPISQPILGGPPRDKSQSFSTAPHGITQYLNEHPPEGQIANPWWWGDWLISEGPPSLQVLIAESSLKTTPQRVWKDYLTIATTQETLERILDRYRINTLVVSQEQTGLDRTVRKLSGWRIVYEDDLGLIATRGDQ